MEDLIKVCAWQSYHDYCRGHHHTVVGNVKIQERVWSPQLQNHRQILVYLPPSYANPDRHFPVLYMHDGQNLFDQSTSFSGEWQVDETMENLARDGVEAIVVGIPNMGVHRLVEYGPFHDTYHGQGNGNLYVDFIGDTLKPIIDRDFRTRPEPESTGILGSSMGGLISLFAFFYRPDIFGLAGVMSPSVWYADRAIFDYVKNAPFNPGKIYLDVGTREYGGLTPKEAQIRSRRYYARVRQLKRILVKKGYRPVRELLHVEEKFAGHNEPAWGRRLPIALRFLLLDFQSSPAHDTIPL